MTSEKDRYKYQDTFLKVWADKRRQPGDDGNFVFCGAPGCGKTRGSSRGAKRMIDAQEIRGVIVVTPTRDLCNSWKVDAVKEGLDLATEYRHKNHGGVSLPRGMHGLVCTYAGLASMVQVFRTICGSHKTLVILDEPHHLNEQEEGEIDNTWGARALQAFEPAAARLLITGTPWRSDGTPIPWVTYDEQGIVKMDFHYSYRDALRDGVVRPVHFHLEDSDNLRYCVGDEETAYTSLNDVAGWDYGRVLSTLYQPSSLWMAAILDRALDKLEEIRSTEHPEAGMLIVCRDIPHAEGVKAILCSRTSGLRNSLGEHDVAIAHSQNEGDDVIKKFREGSQKIIIAVQMVAEGTNIPRLRVGVYSTKRRTELSFHQLIGRTNRTEDGEQDENGHGYKAYWFLPALPMFREYAEIYENDVLVALKEKKEGPPPPPGPETPFTPLEASGVEGGCVIHGITYTAGQVQWLKDCCAPVRVDWEEFAKMCSMQGFPIGEKPAVREPEPLEDRIARLKKKIERLVGLVAHQRYDDLAKDERYRLTRRDVNQIMGVRSIYDNDLTEDQLVGGIRWLETELVSGRQQRWTTA